MTGSQWAEKLTGLSRSVVVAFSVAFLFGVIGVRGAIVATSGTAEGAVRVTAGAASPERADIIDRNGELLATTVLVYSLFADPRAIWDADEVAVSLAAVFPDINTDVLAERLRDRDRAFVWVRRGLTPRQRQTVFELGLEGLGFQAENQRVYPRGSQAGHLLGHTNIDGKGQMGVELALNDRLLENGEPVRLTLDSGVQFALEAELAIAAERYEAIGGAGMVLEVATGEVRALASWPAFNPNRPGDASDTERLNRAITGVYELGSIFKPLTVAAALEAGVLSPSDRFDVRAPIVLRGEVITDTHKGPPQMDVATVLAESSNIGTVHIAQRLGETGLQDFYAKLGLLDRAPVELPGSGAPLLPEAWTDLAIATASYGHGIAVSPLAFGHAFLGVANDGLQPELRVIVSEEKPALKRVMSAGTAGVVVDMLRGAVVKGTGANGDAPGYEVAGKTGTAEKPIAGGYAADRNVTSFAALFPASSPEYVVLIMLDDPRWLEGDGGATAAWNAAPAAGRVIERIAPLLGVSPRLEQAALNDASRQRSVP